jgi:hypothetical protein
LGGPGFFKNHNRAPNPGVKFSLTNGPFYVL